MEMREKIAEGAAKLFMRYGVRAISMDDVASQMGMSKKTIYQYFTDKEELVDASIKWDVDFDQRECICCTTASSNAIDEVFSIIAMMAEQMVDVNPLILFELQKFYPAAFLHFKKHKDEFILNAITANLQRGINEGLYREGLNIEVLAKFRVESIMLIFNPDAFPITKKYAVMDLMAIISEHFLYGIATPKGVKIIQKHIEDLKQSKS